MSDKETAPWIKRVAAEILVGKDRCPICRWTLAESASKGCVIGNCSFRPEHCEADVNATKRRRAEWEKVCQIIAGSVAVECTAPAPQQWKSSFTDSDVTGDIHNYVDTGDGKRLWAQDADEIVKRHNEQALQVTPELELEQEADGRWLAEYTRFPGVMAYGPTKEEAIRNAAKVLIESEPASPDLMAVIERLANHGTVAGIRAELRDALHNSRREQASPTPDQCPKCGSTFKPAHIVVGDPQILGGLELCWHSWHSSAATQK